MTDVLKALGATILLVAGCSGGPPVRSDLWRDQPYDPGSLDLPSAAASECPDRSRSRTATGFRLALPGEIDPAAAPLPRTEAERHVFHNLYETLVRIDCEGRLRVGLAATWQAYDGGRVWTFTLRDDARFWDGTPLGAIDVIASWRRAQDLCERRGEPSPFLLFDPRGPGLAPAGARELVIRLDVASDELPLALVHPALAVVGGPGGRGWLLGSGPCRPDSTTGGGALVLVPTPGHPDAPPWRRVEVLTDGGRDPREYLDIGADALVTREREVVAYYAGRRATRVEPLPWDRWYYLVAPAGPDADRLRWTAGWDRLELAREVVAQDAAPADFFPWEPAEGSCPAIPPPVAALGAPALPDADVRASRDADLVLWPGDDADAGRLAERLAAIAARPIGADPNVVSRGPLARPFPPGPGVAAEALAVPERDLTAHLQAARAGAVILPWPRRLPTPCGELARLLSLAEWLREAGLEPGPDTGKIPPGATAARPLDAAEPVRTLAIARRLERDRTVQPLIRTRAHLIHAPDLAGFGASFDGALELWSAGWQSR
ncbi:MAG TPA: ABC transporter substrate-binding protein [Candidatus Krumholzibacteria bacterium]|nr:ABC transporter substrate-binding protein [Candidatus Krumholzibacteria bacterium]HPD71132.1 ABC transporter substrate-binding protein [Candidatus Krumholzibacteria bacterium]HRY39168.1 ABC transporter substrate-binding protein [Candidatus Krumholzibacteria bacterium]